jgi:hypothetical protein
MTVIPAEMFDGKSPIPIRIVNRNGDTALWEARNPVLLEGEAGVCNDTGKFKIGDGVTHFNDLEYYLRQDHIAALVAQMIADAPGGGGGTGDVTTEQLQAHIDSESPHPVYDDGTSFALRYENAKV